MAEVGSGGDNRCPPRADCLWHCSGYGGLWATGYGGMHHFCHGHLPTAGSDSWFGTTTYHRPRTYAWTRWSPLVSLSPPLSGRRRTEQNWGLRRRDHPRLADEALAGRTSSAIQEGARWTGLELQYARVGERFQQNARADAIEKELPIQPTTLRSLGTCAPQATIDKENQRQRLVGLRLERSQISEGGADNEPHGTLSSVAQAPSRARSAGHSADSQENVVPRKYVG